jgi:hypothetical protein
MSHPTPSRPPRATRSSKRDVSRRLADQGTALAGITSDDWTALPDEARRVLIQNIDQTYKQYLESFYSSADLCVDKYNDYTRTHGRWRRTAILGSGILACLNFMAASTALAGWHHGLIPIVAAVSALILAVLANLETFSNAVEKAQTFRESRELFLDAAQEFDRVWTVYVVGLGDSLQAYENAIELYKRIISADSELRSSFKEMGKQK